MTKTALVWDERYLGHDTGPGHPERPERLKAIRQVLPEKALWLDPRRATPSEIERVHAKNHVQQVLDTAGGPSGHFDGDTPYGPRSSDAAFLSAGGVLTAIEAVERGDAPNAFAFPRPPGHHAEASHAMGFCLFNNVAVAAEHLIKEFGRKRIAIIDFDVHHGNGTQHIFYDRPDVFYVSLHQYPFYPGTGSSSETGQGIGLGCTLNVPMTASSDDDDYARAFDEEVMPELTAYAPDFVLVSAGFDAHRLDPLGGMNLTRTGFSMMSRKLKSLADQSAGGRIVHVLEGGYDLKGLQEGVDAVLDSLA
jgi:acetoin utilization deacetylase AcuC-like enzyme